MTLNGNLPKIKNKFKFRENKLEVGLPKSDDQKVTIKKLGFNGNF